jgi:spermidine synthase
LAIFTFVRPVLFFLFFVSGFCSLVYQVIWTRLAFASFGIITPVLSVVLSVFMLGLALGSWAGGRFIGSLVAKTGQSAIIFYAIAELIIGLGAFVVPHLFDTGTNWLLATGQTNSFTYLSLSALVLGFSILPWCLCMGVTFPLMMAFIREQNAREANSFSYLYLANVLGAMSGTFLSAVVLVELFGFHYTLRIAAVGNFIIAAIGARLSRRPGATSSPDTTAGTVKTTVNDPPLPYLAPSRLIRWILFSTGFCAMAMEVVWTRAFTPVLKTQVYSFALIVFTYLGATFLGSLWYRHDLKRNSTRPVAQLIALLLLTSFLPIPAIDPRLVKMDWGYLIHAHGLFTVLGSICPLCAVLGYLTPCLIDQYAAGHPRTAGKAYALNVLGCILGPLFASYVLLPWMRERTALTLLCLPFFVFYFLNLKSLPAWQRVGSGLVAGAALVWSLFFSMDFQDMVSRHASKPEIRHDYAASVIATGKGQNRLLLVNGIGMTLLTPITKFMVHLPMAYHQGTPHSALIICFGMGTTYRAALSWDVDTTAVELIPDVPKVFDFYHADAAQVLKNPKGRIVIDDGRRFLRRTQEKYDVIVVDPPPPAETAGSSLLFSTEFYALAKQHLKPGGILQAWFPGGDYATAQAFMRSVDASFPYTRCFPSIEGWGLHVLASLDPIPEQTPAQLVARMPANAQKDLMEWAASGSVADYMGSVVSREVPIQTVLDFNFDVQITDDEPINEYYLLRQLRLIQLNLYGDKTP